MQLIYFPQWFRLLFINTFCNHVISLLLGTNVGHGFSTNDSLIYYVLFNTAAAKNWRTVIPSLPSSIHLYQHSPPSPATNLLKLLKLSNLYWKTIDILDSFVLCCICISANQTTSMSLWPMRSFINIIGKTQAQGSLPSSPQKLLNQQMEVAYPTPARASSRAILLNSISKCYYFHKQWI